MQLNNNVNIKKKRIVIMFPCSTIILLKKYKSEKVYTVYNITKLFLLYLVKENYSNFL